jgi:hypothetical protein
VEQRVDAEGRANERGRIAALGAPHDRHEVVDLPDGAAVGYRRPGDQRFRRVRLDLGQVEGRVSVRRVDGRARAQLGQLLGRVVSDALREPEAHVTVVSLLVADEERFFDERLEHVDHLRLRVGLGAEHRLCSLQGEAPVEHGALRERAPLPGLQELPGAVERAAERGVPREHVAVAALEEIEARGEPAEELARRQDLHARGSELDRERAQIQSADELARGGLVLAHAERRHDLARALLEERERVGFGQRADVDLSLALEPEPDARGQEEDDPRGLRVPGAHRFRRVLDQLLEVVEDEQERLAGGERVSDRIRCVRARADERDVERRSDGGQELDLRACLGEVAEPDAPDRATRVLQEPRPELTGEASLAGAAGAQQRDEPLARGDERLERLEITLAPDERRPLRREVGRRPSGRDGRGGHRGSKRVYYREARFVSSERFKGHAGQIWLRGGDASR